jgi:two-component system response regulator FixJ
MSENFSVHIVDDDTALRESVKKLIQGVGYSVYAYPSAASFLDYCTSTTGCALIDLRLRDMDGIALQKELISRKAAIDVVMISAYGDIRRAVESMRCGAVDFLEKPFDPDELVARIHGLCEVSNSRLQLQREYRQRAALLDTLTPRERQILKAIAGGQSNKRVATNLAVSSRTVETHRLHIMQKLQADSLAQLVRIWLAASGAALGSTSPLPPAGEG